MARINPERRAAQQREYLLNTFKTLTGNVEQVASTQVLSTDDAFKVDDRALSTLLFEADEVVRLREQLSRDMLYVAENLTDDAKRLTNGRSANDTTRNSSFTGLSAQIAVFNYRLSDVSRRCHSARVMVVELVPHMTKDQLLDTVTRAKVLLDNMTVTQNIDEAFVAECQKAYDGIKWNMWSIY